MTGMKTEETVKMKESETLEMKLEKVVRTAVLKTSNVTTGVQVERKSNQNTCRR